MSYDITPHVSNETSPLEMVIVGLPQSSGAPPTLEEAYDARSYRAVEEGNYPTEEDVVVEMENLATLLQREGVTVLRPSLIPDYNQLFARDVAFAIEDKLYIANMIPEREKEIEAYKGIIDRIDPSAVIHLPEEVHAEGGDMMLYNDIIFMGVTDDSHYEQYKMARTNEAALAFFREQFPQKRIIPIHLKKHDHRPEDGILHLDCAFQPVGKDKAVYFPEGFIYEEERKQVEEIFGKENLFAITREEAFDLATNLFSISPSRVVVEHRFERLIQHLQEEWHIDVIPIPYYEISKQGGLLRCSTCPLVRS